MSVNVKTIKMGNKILLVNHPSISNKGIYKELKYPPMGIMFLASVLRQHGYQPTIFDGDIESRALGKLERLIKEGDFKIMGISFSSMTSEGAFEAAKMIKKIDPSITVIAGGYHPTVMIKDTLLRPFFDFLVYGEGEYTLPELLNFISGKDKKISIENILGVAFKKGEEWAVHINNCGFESGAKKITTDSMLASFNPKYKEEKEYLDEAFSYIRGDKLEFFKSLLK